MAFLAYKEVDGILLNEDSDVVDGIPEQVLHISRHTDNHPTRFYRQKLLCTQNPDTKQNEQRLSEKSSRFRMIHVNWGSDLAPLDYTKNVLALLQLSEKNKKIEEENAKKLQESLQFHHCDIVRWDVSHLLVQLPDGEAGNDLGKAFLEEKLDNVDGYRIESIEPSVLTNPPKVLFEVNTSQVDDVSQCLSKVIAPFAARFTYIVLRENDSGHDQSSGKSPALIVTLLFHGRSQANAERTLQHLKQSQWTQVQLPPAVTSGIDYPVVLFENTQYHVPMIGVQIGCPQSGIQLTIIVQDLNNFDVMEKFYCKVTSLNPLRRNVDGSSFRYCTFPLSSRAELVVAYYPEFSAQSLHNASIYIQVTEVKHIENLIRIGEDHWHTNDPEGNRVVLYMPLK